MLDCDWSSDVCSSDLGVLFLDELPEFRRSVLEAMRQPLEDKVVRVVRVHGAEEFPADFQLVAAMNPCLCGHLGDDRVACRCSETQIAHYRGRVSGPLLDRIDMCVHVPAVTSRDLLDGPPGEGSAPVRARVSAARTLARKRRSAALQLETDSRALLRRAMDRGTLSARGASRVTRVARTIADLDAAGRVTPTHLGEALGYRLTS
jgi:magnesium chelatase family protein